MNFCCATTQTQPEEAAGFWIVGFKDFVSPLAAVLISVIAWCIFDRKIRKRGAAYRVGCDLLNEAHSAMDGITPVLRGNLDRSQCRELMAHFRMARNAIEGLQNVMNSGVFGKQSTHCAEIGTRIRAPFDEIYETVTGKKFPADVFSLPVDKIDPLRTQIRTQQQALRDFRVTLIRLL